MNPEEITLVIGIDRHHLEELRWTWPTWMRFKPEIHGMPVVVFYDPSQVNPEKEASFLREHPQLRFVPWTWKFGRDQWEKMITGWIHIPATEVKTPWYIKLDTDAIATDDGEWIKDDWFAPGPRGTLPAFIASPWRFSRPSHIINLLDDWADTIPEMAVFPRLNLPFIPGKKRIYHPKIISWLFFGRTSWAQKLASLLGPQKKLPIFSEDTFHMFCADRMKDGTSVME